MTTYSEPLLLRGDMIAALSAQPNNNGNPGDADFGIVFPNATALATPDQLFRLLWYQNTNQVDAEFGNGQFWRLESYNRTADTDLDPRVGDEGWTVVSGYEQLIPKHDLVSNLGAGDDYIVLEGAQGFLLYDIRGGLPTTPTTLTYLASNENGSLRAADQVEITRLLPAMAQTLGPAVPARPLSDGKTTRRLVRRHLKENRPMFC